MAAIHKDKDLVLQGETLSDNIQKDVEVTSFLQGKDVSVQLLSKGSTLITSVRAAESLVKVATGREVSLSELVRMEYHSLKLEFSQFRFSAERALTGRTDLLAEIGIVVKKRGRKGKGSKEAPPPPTTAAASPAVEPAKEGAKSGDTAQEDRRRRPHEGLEVPRFVARVETDLGNALNLPEVVKALEPYGYGQPELEKLVARVKALGQAHSDLRTAEGVVRGAKKDVHAARKAFRLWYVPWRRKLIGALKDRPDFLTRLGLPVPKKRERKGKKGTEKTGADTQTKNAKTDPSVEGKQVQNPGGTPGESPTPEA